MVLFRSSPSGLADTMIGASVRLRDGSASVSACATGAASISEQTSGLSARAPRLLPAPAAFHLPRNACLSCVLPFIFTLIDVISLQKT